MDIDLLLTKLGKPAQRAILGAGITSFQQLTKLTLKDLSSLHGIGKHALGTITQILKENGLELKHE